MCFYTTLHVILYKQFTKNKKVGRVNFPEQRYQKCMHKNICSPCTILFSIHFHESFGRTWEKAQDENQVSCISRFFFSLLIHPSKSVQDRDEDRYIDKEHIYLCCRSPCDFYKIPPVKPGHRHGTWIVDFFHFLRSRSDCLLNDALSFQEEEEGGKREREGIVIYTMESYIHSSILIVITIHIVIMCHVAIGLWQLTIVLA